MRGEVREKTGNRGADGNSTISHCTGFRPGGHTYRSEVMYERGHDRSGTIRNISVTGMCNVLTNIADDLFVGEAKLFFSHPRRISKVPFRLEFASGNERHSRPSSLSLCVSNRDMILLHDSRLDPVRMEQILRTTDIATETRVPAYEPDNAGRWTNLRETSDGRHWSDGEYHRRGTLAPSSKCERTMRVEETALARLTAQLPQFASEAVRDGRAIVISRSANILDHVWGGDSKSLREKANTTHGLHASRLSKVFGNHVYALRRTEVGTTNRQRVAEDAIAILIVGKFWPEECGGGRTSMDDQARDARPTLTVVRKRETNGTVGGRVICICLGNFLSGTSEGLGPEEIARVRRHYEGYITEAEYESSLSKRQ